MLRGPVLRKGVLLQEMGSLQVALVLKRRSWPPDVVLQHQRDWWSPVGCWDERVVRVGMVLADPSPSLVSKAASWAERVSAGGQIKHSAGIRG